MAQSHEQSPPKNTPGEVGGWPGAQARMPPPALAAAGSCQQQEKNAFPGAQSASRGDLRQIGQQAQGRRHLLLGSTGGTTDIVGSVAPRALPRQRCRAPNARTACWKLPAMPQIRPERTLHRRGCISQPSPRAPSTAPAPSRPPTPHDAARGPSRRKAPHAAGRKGIDGPARRCIPAPGGGRRALEASRAASA
jgi:hypothetical protein